MLSKIYKEHYYCCNIPKEMYEIEKLLSKEQQEYFVDNVERITINEHFCNTNFFLIFGKANHSRYKKNDWFRLFCSNLTLKQKQDKLLSEFYDSPSSYFKMSCIVNNDGLGRIKNPFKLIYSVFDLFKIDEAKDIVYSYRKHIAISEDDVKDTDKFWCDVYGEHCDFFDISGVQISKNFNFERGTTRECVIVMLQMLYQHKKYGYRSDFKKHFCENKVYNDFIGYICNICYSNLKTYKSYKPKTKIGQNLFSVLKILCPVIDDLYKFKNIEKIINIMEGK